MEKDDIGGNVGGMDGFGVAYSNSTHNYNAYVIRTAAYITDADHDRQVSTANRDDGDGKMGFGFRLQDYTYGVFSRKYVGYKWYGSCTYNSSFESYNGIATAYYIHTFRNAQITSISFNSNSNGYGLPCNISVSDEYFQAYSVDKPFGVR